MLAMSGSFGGPGERRLLNDLMMAYNSLERCIALFSSVVHNNSLSQKTLVFRPVIEEESPINLTFGLALQQIVDLVSSYISMSISTITIG